MVIKKKVVAKAPATKKIVASVKKKTASAPSIKKTLINNTSPENKKTVAKVAIKKQPVVQPPAKKIITKPNTQTIARIPIGVSGLDEVTEGGFEKNSAVLISGGGGSGKTILPKRKDGSGTLIKCVMKHFFVCKVRLRLKSMKSFNFV